MLQELDKEIVLMHPGPIKPRSRTSAAKSICTAFNILNQVEMALQLHGGSIPWHKIKSNETRTARIYA
jgi:hypothetical protein